MLSQNRQQSQQQQQPLHQQQPHQQQELQQQQRRLEESSLPARQVVRQAKAGRRGVQPLASTPRWRCSRHRLCS